MSRKSKIPQGGNNGDSGDPDPKDSGTPNNEGGGDNDDDDDDDDGDKTYSQSELDARIAEIVEQHQRETKGLRDNKDKILDEKRQRDADLDAFKRLGLTPQKAEQILTQLAETEEDKYIKDGDVEGLRRSITDREKTRWNSVIEEKDARIAELETRVQSMHDEYGEEKRVSQITRGAINAGIIDPARQKAALKLALDVFRLDTTDNKLYGYNDAGEKLPGIESDFMQPQEWFERVAKKEHGYLFGRPNGSKAQNDLNGEPDVKDSNPWKLETRSLSRQKEILEGDPDKAARLKKEAGVV